MRHLPACYWNRLTFLSQPLARCVLRNCLNHASNKKIESSFFKWFEVKNFISKFEAVFYDQNRFLFLGHPVYKFVYGVIIAWETPPCFLLRPRCKIYDDQRLASLGIIGAQLRDPWKPSNHHSILSYWGVWGWPFNWVLIVPKDDSLSESRCEIFPNRLLRLQFPSSAAAGGTGEEDSPAASRYCCKTLPCYLCGFKVSITPPPKKKRGGEASRSSGRLYARLIAVEIPDKQKISYQKRNNKTSPRNPRKFAYFSLYSHEDVIFITGML